MPSVNSFIDTSFAVSIPVDAHIDTAWVIGLPQNTHIRLLAQERIDFIY